MVTRNVIVKEDETNGKLPLLCSTEQQTACLLEEKVSFWLNYSFKKARAISAYYLKKLQLLLIYCYN